MKHLVEFPLEGSEEVLFVEVEEDEEGSIRKASALGEKIERASETLEDSLKKLHCNCIMAQGKVKPDGE